MQTQILVVLFFCHLLADYTHLSTNWMLKAKALGTPIYPILIHATVHASLMLICLSLFFNVTGYLLLIMFLLQLITHFLIDLLKGKLNYWIPSLKSPANKWHWIVFGTDQYLHALIIILMSYFVTR